MSQPPTGAPQTPDYRNTDNLNQVDQALAVKVPEKTEPAIGVTGQSPMTQIAELTPSVALPTTETTPSTTVVPGSDLDINKSEADQYQAVTIKTNPQAFHQLSPVLDKEPTELDGLSDLLLRVSVEDKPVSQT